MGKPEIISKRKREPKAESLKDIILKKLTRRENERKRKPKAESLKNIIFKKLTEGEKDIVLISHLTLGSIPDARKIYRLVGEAQRRAGRQATLVI